ncbi:MAG: hypothetical protein KGM99_20675 [Burkholderiales bacterium]|nr:hypothetical protein [Burkholderiales bacterium]
MRKNKKNTERFHFSQFQKLYDHFPKGDVVDDDKQERPDFLIKTDQKVIGVELTRIQANQGDINNKTAAAQSNAEQIAPEAQKFYAEMIAPSVQVSMYFHDSELVKMSVSERAKVGQRIAQLVYKYCPAPDSANHDICDDMGLNEIPSCVTNINVSRIKGLRPTLFQSPRASWVAVANAQDIYFVLNNKESSVSDYLKKCDEIWLVIILDAHQTFTWRSEISCSEKIKSNFNKIFLLSSFRNKLVEVAMC